MSSYYGKENRQYGHISYERKYLLDPKYMTKKDMQYYRYYNLSHKRGQFKKIILIVFCICFFSYIFIDYNLKTKLINLKSRFDFVARMDADYNVTQAYFVDTTGCRMPYFEVTDDNILQFMFKPRNYTCNKALTRTSDMGSKLWLNMDQKELLDIYNITQLDKLHCVYIDIKRKTDQHNRYLQKVPFQLVPEMPIQIRAGYEFVRVDCSIDDDKIIYTDFHFFALNKSGEPLDTAEGKSSSRTSTSPSESSVSMKPPPLRFVDTSKTRRRSKKSEADEQVSVMVLGIDSVSHLNFLRQMRNTASYIHNKLEHVEFWGYNKVGDNTYPNLVAMLSGLDETELNMACLSRPQATYDRCAFIWKRFKEAGYQTAYAEDVAYLGLFNYLREGFKVQPTDYYLRPMMLEMEQHISYKNSINVDLCKGGRRTIDVLLEFIRKLIPLMQTQNFFSFFWTVAMSHDYLNMPMLIDSDFVQLLDSFESAGLFNRSVILLVSDHGLRWGSFRKTYQGMMEERQPLLMALYPKWLTQKYPNAVKNLRLNSKRLTTHYDVHATLLDLLDLKNLDNDRLATRTAELTEMDTLARGISLFLPIPETRTCETAGIASHWCTCHHRQELPTNEFRVQRAARYIVRLINGRLKSNPQCRTLYLNSILEAIIATPHHVKDVTSEISIDITVRIQTKPGLGIFESTVRMSSYEYSLTGTISRINLYKSQSYCIDDNALKMFCYCHR